MARFYMDVMNTGKGGATRPHRLAHSSGVVRAASYRGAIVTHLYVNNHGQDCARVTREPWQSSDERLPVVLFDGPLDMSGFGQESE